MTPAQLETLEATASRVFNLWISADPGDDRQALLVLDNYDAVPQVFIAVRVHEKLRGYGGSRWRWADALAARPTP